MPYCPCCSDSLLHHIRGAETYWFCRSCWQEMPVLTQRSAVAMPKPILAKLATKVTSPENHRNSSPLHQRNSLQSRLVSQGGIKN